MKRAADHAMLVARRVQAEQKYARTKNLNDLTGILRANKAITTELSKSPQNTGPRVGAPIGQRWE